MTMQQKSLNAKAQSFGFSTKVSDGYLMIATGGPRAIDAESAMRLLGIEKAQWEQSAYQIWLVISK